MFLVTAWFILSSDHLEKMNRALNIESRLHSPVLHSPVPCPLIMQTRSFSPILCLGTAATLLTCCSPKVWMFVVGVRVGAFHLLSDAARNRRKSAVIKPGGRGSKPDSPGWPICNRKALYDARVPWSDVAFLFSTSEDVPLFTLQPMWNVASLLADC